MKRKIQVDFTEITYMNVKTIAVYLGVARSTIYKWVETGFIPHRKLIKHVLFIKKEVDEWVSNNGIREYELPELPISIRSSHGDIQHRA